jgi:hypothetical protein
LKAVTEIERKYMIETTEMWLKETNDSLWGKKGCKERGKMTDVLTEDVIINVLIGGTRQTDNCRTRPP